MARRLVRHRKLMAGHIYSGPEVCYSTLRRFGVMLAVLLHCEIQPHKDSMAPHSLLIDAVFVCDNNTTTVHAIFDLLEQIPKFSHAGGESLIRTERVATWPLSACTAPDSTQACCWGLVNPHCPNKTCANARESCNSMSFAL